MNDVIEKKALKKLTPQILKRMGNQFVDKVPDAMNALAPVLAKKEIMITEVAKALAPVLCNVTGDFIDYLKESNRLAVQLNIKNYDLVSNVIFNNPDMSFEEKKVTIILLKEQDRQDKNQNNKFKLTALGILATVVGVLKLGPTYIEKRYDFKKHAITEKRRTDIAKSRHEIFKPHKKQS